MGVHVQGASYLKTRLVVCGVLWLLLKLCYRGPTHRGGKSGGKLVTLFGSYSYDGLNAAIGFQHTEVPNLGASWSRFFAVTLMMV